MTKLLRFERAGIVLLSTVASVVSTWPLASSAAPAVAPVRGALPAMRGRFTNSASCASATTGSASLDSGVVFALASEATFAVGSSDIAAGAESFSDGSSNTSCDNDASTIGGYGNTIDSGSGSAPAGAEYSFIGGGLTNLISAANSSIGAGADSMVSGQGSALGAANPGFISGNSSAIASGSDLTVSGAFSFAAAGQYEQVSGSNAFGGTADVLFVQGNDAFAGAGAADGAAGNGSFAGAGNSINENSFATAPISNVSGADAFLGAGDENTVSANASFTGSGSNNSIASGATDATILAGSHNSVSAEYASILGGFGNVASGPYAIVAGGDGNTAAGTLSFAAGYHADAAHSGSFVWSDYRSGSKPVSDTGAGQFIVRASGGTIVYSNEAASSGVSLAAGSGAWSNLSDRNAKTAIAPADEASVLERVDALPIGTWRYQSERTVRHLGPMAQDFYASFGLGEDDRHIASIDEGGVALAAIGVLHRENRLLESRNARMRRENADLQVRLALLAHAIVALRADDGIHDRSCSGLRSRCGSN